ncbi:hypothetical protein [Lactiplantibacillus plantarum]|uniref:hypothetical protein n=1 Tax=Lactiplantibacillus plantarum TaxID=1590 RepID=UPI001BAA1A80|nr:hypothetical protein [Lactiplantibacillus plantarum]MBS0936611.1 hypothetical protein [Lactiplantibacillus plantarum]MBS0943808.1 hypothetical protein [Lactiplantibacillus plantarum]
MDFYEQLEQIDSPKTRLAMREVISSYQNGNYRSATNALYSTVILDLVEKLQTLATMYGDDKAKKLLNEARSKQEANAFDPSWEKDLIDGVEKDEFRSNRLRASLTSLKEFRNLSSHPSIGEDSVDLFVPDQRLVAGLIRSITTDLFNQSPNLITNVTGSLTDNLLRQKDELQSDSKMLDSYLQTVYLNHLAPARVERLVKDLFKFVFCKVGKEYDEGRLINFKALLFFIENNQQTLIESLKNTHSLLEKVELSDDTILSLTLDFIRRYPTFLGGLPDFMQTKLAGQVKSSAVKTILNPTIYASSNISLISEISKALNDWSLFEEMKKKLDFQFSWFDLLNMKLSKDEIMELQRYMTDIGAADDFKDFILAFFENSKSFEQANTRYDYLRIILDDCTEDELKKLLAESDYNDQIYYSNQGKAYIRKAVAPKYAKRLKQEDHKITRGDIISKLKNDYSNLFEDYTFPDEVFD